jgi:uncharacterized protein (TIGR02284 family)
MTRAPSHDIHVLNGLIETTLDSADGYRDAATGTQDERYRGLFEQRSFERQQVATDLQSHVRQMGGTPEDDGSILAKAQRAFADIKHALLGDDLTVISSVGSGEDALKGRFEKALADSDVSATTKEAIRRAWDAVKSGCDEMHALKRSLEGQHDASNRLYPQ